MTRDATSSLPLRLGLVGASCALAALGASLSGCLQPTARTDLRPPPGSVWSGPPEGGRLADGLATQSLDDVDAKSAGCVTCHDVEKMHAKQRVRLGCTDCHGGNARTTDKYFAHVQPADDALEETSAVPPSQSAEWLRHRFDYIRFVNPGDLRVVDETCGVCHPNETYATKKSMMAHGAMLWGAALYNNGSFPHKRPHFGEAYDRDGHPVRIQTVPPPTQADITERGVLPFLDPLPRYNVAQMGNILRVFERGGRRPLELGNPDREEEAGLPGRRLSQRGLGTLLRTDPVFLGLTKTRLLDPVLWMPGTNDHPGDYRHSGCTACHVIYANDRDPEHSGRYAQFGNRGRSHGRDPSIPKEESGHPIVHQMTRGIPSSQCMTCHMHPGTNMLTTYYGNLWYDNETDAHLLYDQDGSEPTAAERHAVNEKNPQGAAVRGKWKDPEFLADIATKNDQFKKVQFADYHGHGWLYRKVWKKDRKGNLLDADGKVVSFDDPDVWKKAVHLKDIHLERGMHCVDCHFTQDVHGTGKLHGEPRAATEIMCVDCHGDVDAPANLVTSGPAGGNSLEQGRTPFGRDRFFRAGGVLYQRSQMERHLVWAVPQVADSVDPSKKGVSYFPGDAKRERPVYNERACYAKTVQSDGRSWGDGGAGDRLAHRNERMSCVACHTSWTTSCFGCHLPMEANARKDLRHYEGGQSRNWVGYNFQVLRDAAYMLAVDGTVTGNKVSPARSACAIVVGSKNQNREHLYSQQQTISAEGFSGQAFSTYVPHTVRTTETKTCTECHVSEKEDNNALMAQLLLQGTNYTNFMGRFCYVGCGDAGFYAVVVSERDEPQAVYGSTLQRDAYPKRFAAFEQQGRVLTESYHHGGADTRSIQLRGEYLYAAEGEGGLQVYDVANIDNKGFSERITTSVVSPLGQRLAFDSEFATAVASPTTLGVDPTRPQRAENEEQSIHPMYAFLYVTDRKEGLIMTIAATLLDGDPANNFLERDLVFNPKGVLNGAETITIAGGWAYVGCDQGLVILDLSKITLTDPTPRVAKVIGKEHLSGVTSVAVQFRYAFVTHAGGMSVLDVTDPERATPIRGAHVPLKQARDVYVARTYAYVSAGSEGLVIVDVERPAKPRVHLKFTADGALNDTRQCRVAMTNASLFAYVADGKNGLRVVQLTSPETVPQFAGFSPAPKPRLIATYPTPAPALALSKPLDRDRAVDETGNQLAVFGRIGSRPLNLLEQRRLYVRDGKVWRVSDTPKTRPVAPAAGTK